MQSFSFCHIEFLTCDKLAHGGLSHEQQGGIISPVPQVPHKGSALVAVVVTQVISRSSLVTEAHQRNVCHFDGMHASHICENADLVCIHTGKINLFSAWAASLFLS